MSGTPGRTDRPDDGFYAYEGLISVNILTPSGADWDAFTDDVRDAFSDSHFDGYSRLTPEDEVFVGYKAVHVGDVCQASILIIIKRPRNTPNIIVSCTGQGCYACHISDDPEFYVSHPITVPDRSCRSGK